MGQATPDRGGPTVFSDLNFLGALSPPTVFHGLQSGGRAGAAVLSPRCPPFFLAVSWDGRAGVSRLLTQPL